MYGLKKAKNNGDLFFLDQRPRLVPLYRKQMRIAGVTSLQQKKHKVPLAHAFSNIDPETNAITKEPAKNKPENNFCEHKTSWKTLLLHH
jgi:hypothetical protein